MSLIGVWWEAEVLHGHKGPLLLSFVAFVVTFLATRTITRMIRAGRGPFRNLSSGGVHLHHSTPGVVLLVTGAFTAVAAVERSPLAYVSAVLVGVGASLVLDEFAMIFHLDDVYWTQEGQLSVNVVTLSAACVGLAVIGVSPVSVDGLTGDETLARSGAMALLVADLLLIAVTALKGKYPTALLGVFISPLAWVGAVRMARPTSPWARWWYGEHRTRRARERAERFDRRWGSLRRRWDHLIAGAPSLPPRRGPG